MPRSADTLAAHASRDNNSFGVVRLAAAIMVIVTHAYGVVGGWNAEEPLAQSTGFSLGSHAVNVFFILSGFMVAASWERSANWLDFAAARLLRIMPALICVNLLIVLAGGLFLTTASPAQYWSVENIGLFLYKATVALSATASLAGVFETAPIPGAIDTPIWTIRFEIVCYMTLMAFLGLMSRLRLQRTGRLIAISAILAASAWVMSLDESPHVFRFAGHMARFVFAFYLGVLAWTLRDLLRIRFAVAAALVALAAAAYGLPWLVRLPLTLVATAYLAFWVGSRRMGWLQRETTRTDLSYGAYICGFFIQQWLIVALPGSSVLLNATLATAIALVVAFISWTLIEKPALSLRKSPIVAKLSRMLAGERGWTLRPAETGARPME